MNRAGSSVPTSPADQAARQLDQTLRHLVSVVSEQTAVAKAALPQFFSAADLAKRWNCGHDQVVKYLEGHAGYQGARGHRVSVSLDDVLRIDAALKVEYDVRKAVTAKRSHVGGRRFGAVLDVAGNGDVIVQMGGAHAS